MGRLARTIAASVALPSLLVAQPAPDARPVCGPSLLQADEPASLIWRWSALRHPDLRFGFRTPFVDFSECRNAVVAGTEVRTGIDERLGERRFLPGNRAPRFDALTLAHQRNASTVVRGWARRGSRVQGFAQLGTFGSEVDLQQLAAVVSAGPLYGWVGRQAAGYGLGPGGAIVLSGTVPLDGVGVGTRRPFRLPWHLRHLGLWDFEFFVARGADNGPIGHPGVGGARGTIQPISWLTFGASRGAQFFGEGAPGLTWRRFVSVLKGSHLKEDGERLNSNNHIVTLDAVVRTKVFGAPSAFYFEIGAEDAAGAIRDSPSIVAGFEIAHPTQWLIIGLNQTYMHPANGHGYFYRHGLYTAGWSDDGRGLGHPLGGPGREWQIHATSIDNRDRWTIDAGVFTRDRFEGISIGADLVGRSMGGRLNAQVRSGPINVFARFEGERHENGLKRLAGSAGLRWTWGPIR